MKMVHFPSHTGLKPRQFDNYDRVCLRYFTAFRNASVRRECETELLRLSGNVGDLDYDYSHGRNLATKYTIK